MNLACYIEIVQSARVFTDRGRRPANLNQAIWLVTWEEPLSRFNIPYQDIAFSRNETYLQRRSTGHSRVNFFSP